MTSHSEPPAAVVRHATAAAMRDAGAVAVVRLRDCRQVIPVAAALLAGGVRVLELTLTTVGALPAIAALEHAFGVQLLVGVGSVRSEREARDALDAGARFLVSPIGDPDIMAAAHARGVPVALGAFTPTEMSRVHDGGADFVKLFPADALGPRYVRSVLAPMPYLSVMPTGGVTPANVGEWLAAGCVAVGLGSSLVDTATVDAGAWQVLQERARTTAAAVARHRATLAPRDPTPRR